MVTLDGADLVHEVCDLVEAFLAGGGGEFFIHDGVFVVFAIGGFAEVIDGGWDGVRIEGFEPKLCVFFFV